MSLDLMTKMLIFFIILSTGVAKKESEETQAMSSSSFTFTRMRSNHFGTLLLNLPRGLREFFAFSPFLFLSHFVWKHQAYYADRIHADVANTERIAWVDGFVKAVRNTDGCVVGYVKS